MLLNPLELSTGDGGDGYPLGVVADGTAVLVYAPGGDEHLIVDAPGGDQVVQEMVADLAEKGRRIWVIGDENGEFERVATTYSDAVRMLYHATRLPSDAGVVLWVSDTDLLGREGADDVPLGLRVCLNQTPRDSGVSVVVAVGDDAPASRRRKVLVAAEDSRDTTLYVPGSPERCSAYTRDGDFVLDWLAV